MGGKATFFYALIAGLPRVEEHRGDRRRFDEGERRGRMHDVVVANGVWHGGGMMLAPDAVPGRRPVRRRPDRRRLEDSTSSTTAPKIYKGRHVTHPKVEVVRSARVRSTPTSGLPIEVEGEQVGTTPADFEVVPGALRIRVPR